jgi:hypothetical protein
MARPRRTASAPKNDAAGALGIYDGQERAGTVVRQGELFYAFNSVGRCIGAFDSMIEAARAIPRRTEEVTR